MAGALEGIRVVEIAGLAPAPFAGMLLADFGADVVRVDRVNGHGQPVASRDTLARGKRSLALDLKSEAGRNALLRVLEKADVLIEPFRPGVMERLGLGPDVVCARNPRIVYARMTGFGQGGDSKVERAAGHDIDYLAVSGILSALRKEGEPPNPPINLLGDFAGGGHMLATGILLALIERAKSGKGQIIDGAMIDGANYLAMFVYRANMLGGWKNGLDEVGTSLLDGGAPFYCTYTCKDGNHIAVGAIEPQFYKLFLEGLGLDEKKDQLPRQHDKTYWKASKERFAAIIATKTRDEWAEIYEGTDACTFPVLNFEEAKAFKHNKLRGSFAPSADLPGSFEPAPAPKLSRTPGLAPRKSPMSGDSTEQVLQQAGFAPSEIEQLLASKAIGKAKL